jgi:putative transposase
VRRACKLRAYPTRPQEGRAARLLADHRDLDNAALAERREAWRMRNLSVTDGDQSAQLKQVRAADPDGQGRHSFTAQQPTLRRLDVVFAAYVNCLRDARGKARRVGSPRCKPDQRFDQVLFVAGGGARWEPADGGRWADATFQAVGRVKVHQHRPVVGRGTRLQLKRIAGLQRRKERAGRAPGIAGGCGGRSPKGGARSATGGGTSTTRPPAGWSTPATPSRSNPSAWLP